MTCLTCALHRSGTVAGKLYLGNFLNSPVKDLAWFYSRMWENMAAPFSPFFSYGALQAFITPLQRVQIWGGVHAHAGKDLCVLRIYRI